MQAAATWISLLNIFSNDPRTPPDVPSCSLPPSSWLFSTLVLEMNDAGALMCS